MITMRTQAWSRRRIVGVAGALTLALATVACTSGPPTAGGADTAGAGQTGTAELRMLSVQSGGAFEGLQSVVAAFNQANPDVHITLENTDSATYNTNIKLLASADDAPDLIEVGQGNTQMRPLVEAGLLLSLEKYNEQYKWTDRIDAKLLDQSRATDDGKAWGTGTLYGVPYVGNMIGIYYNRADVKALGVDPTAFKTVDDLNAALAKAKAAGKVPIFVGNADNNGDSGEKPWEALAAAFQTPEQKINWISGQPGASIDNPNAIAATQQLVDWIGAGYFNDDAAGVGREDAVGRFAKGGSVFMITGSWMLGTIKDAGGDDIGYVRMPEARAGEVARASGATGQPFSVSVKSKYPDQAARFLDYLASEATAQTLFDAGSLPLVGADRVSTDSKLVEDALGAWDTLVTTGVLTLHTDWATPSTQLVLNPTIQAFYLGKGTPQEFVKAMQADWEQFKASS